MMTAESPALGIPTTETSAQRYRKREANKRTVEGAGESIESDDDNDPDDESSERRANTGLGLDGGAGERPSGGVRAEEGSDRVRNTDCDELLVGIDLVVVDAAETCGEGRVSQLSAQTKKKRTFGDGNVLQEENDGRDGDERTEEADKLWADVGLVHLLEPRRNRLDDGDVVLGDRFVAKVDPREDGEEDDDKGGAKGVDEEGDSLHERVPRATLDAGRDTANNVEEEEARKSERRITLRAAEVLERVDDDLVGGSSGAVEGAKR